MKEIMFFIPNLRGGGAEKVLVTLVNNLDKSKYRTTVITLFDEGVNKEYLSQDIIYKYIFKKTFKANSYFLKIFTPKFLYKRMIKDKYDIIIAYLEGIPTRILSGCEQNKVKKIAWVHSEMKQSQLFYKAFRNIREAQKCYHKYDAIVGVSADIVHTLKKHIESYDKYYVKYNVIDTDLIYKNALENVDDIIYDPKKINIISVGRLIEVKGYERLLRIYKKIIDKGILSHLYILGEGNERDKLEGYIKENRLEENITLLGYKSNPYKYVKKADLFVCSSYREGFSTAVTEAVILGVPIITTSCSGMKELLGDSNCGIIVENNEEALYAGLLELLLDHDRIDLYKCNAQQRSEDFNMKQRVLEIEDLLNNI